MDFIEYGPRSSRDLRLRRLVAAVLLAWLAALGVDFFVHGGVLAWLYVEPGPFLLARGELFARIPLGYAAHGLWAVLMAWLLRCAGIRGGGGGFAFGLRLGALVSAAQVLALLSVSTASPALLTGWLLAQTGQVGAMGAVAGSALGDAPLGIVAAAVVASVAGLVALTILLQTLGLAPTTASA